MSFSIDGFCEESFSASQDAVAVEDSAFQTFLARVRAPRCWLFEVDALSLAVNDALSGGFSDSGFGDVGFSDAVASATGGQVTLRYGTHEYVSKVETPVKLLSLPGTADDGVRATDLDFLVDWDGAIDYLLKHGTFTRAGATATRVNESGLIETVAADTPRLDYDPVTLACKGLLIEEARTNLCLQNRQFDTTWSPVWSIGITQDANGIDGAANKAWTLDEIDPSNASSIYQQFTIANDSLTHIASFYILKDSNTSRCPSLRMNLIGGTAGKGSRAVSLNTATGAFGSEGGPEFYGVVDAGLWWRAYVGVTNNSTGNTVLQIQFFPAYSATPGGPIDVALLGSVIVDAAQLEKASFMSSVIFTTSAAVTRNADAALISDISDFFNAAEGTLVAELDVSSKIAGTYNRMVAIDDGTTSERLNIWSDGVNTHGFVVDGGAVQADLAAGLSAAVGVTSRAVLAYKLNDFAVSLDGAAVVTDSSGTLPTVTTLRLGANAILGYLNGHLRRLTYFPKRLANASIVSLSGNGPTLTPSSIFASDPDFAYSYDGRVKDNFTVSRDLSNRDGVGGLARVYAEISLSNADGELDSLLNNYALDGRAVRLLVGDVNSTYAEFGKVFSGVVDSVTITEAVARFRLSDGISRIDVPIQPTKYAGTGGLEGGDDLIGKPKPKCYGARYNVTPVLVDAANLIWQVHDGAINDVPAVRDRGVALTKVAGAPGAGEYQVDTSNGTFTLGATPAGTVTCDVGGDAPTGGYSNQLATIAQRLLFDKLYTSDIDTTAFANLNSIITAPVGIWTGTEERMVSSVLDELLFGAGCFGGFSRQGVFTVGRIAAPSADSQTFELDDTSITSIERQPLPAALEPIVWATTVGWRQNQTVQTDLAAATADADRVFAAEQWRISRSEDAAVQSRHRLAKEYGPIPSPFTVQADGDAESVRLLALWGADRGHYRIGTVIEGMLADIGSVGTITHSRHGLQNGKAARVLGQTIKGGSVELRVIT